jgi:hypothetical protein
MSNGLFRNLILARAMTVEPIARALCSDPPDCEQPFSRPGGRWRKAALRAARASAVIEVDDIDEAASAMAAR